jgi:pimeloyl-ACP methyl ester carboxylesterase
MKCITLIFALFAILTQAATAQQNPKLSGDWKGYINVHGQHLNFKTHFKKKKNSYTGVLDIPAQGVKGKPLQNIKTQDDSVFFQQNQFGAKFDGAFKTDSTIAGRFYQHGATLPFKLKRYTPKWAKQRKQRPKHNPNNQKKHNLSGHWKGELSQGTTLLGKFKSNFNYEKDHYRGTFTVQSHSFPFKKAHITKDDSVLLYIVKGMDGPTHFKGIFKNDSLITGKMVQKGFSFNFKLRRYNPAEKKKAKSKPYHHKDVIIQENDSIKIGGTLTWPEHQKAKQLVIMITGSGSLNRNEELHGVSEFEPIASYLTRHGIATYRYDDRGVGESTGNKHKATLNLLVSDVKTIINHFSKNPDHHFSTIVLLGHSQGGIVAGKTAAEDSLVDKLILISSPSIKLIDVINYQIKGNLKPFGIEKPEIQKTVTAYDKVLNAAKNGKELDKAKKQYHQQYEKMMKTLPDSINSQGRKFIKMLGSGILRMSLSPMFKSTNFYNPAKDLRKLNIPVLALFGGKDFKVQIGKNLKPMASALDSAGVSYQINVFKNANHSYVLPKARNINEYSKYKNNPFVKGFLPTITKWLKRTNKAK